jgi:hypothetical protein
MKPTCQGMSLPLSPLTQPPDWILQHVKLSKKPAPAVASLPAPSGHSLRPRADVDHSQGATEKPTSTPKVKVEGHPVRILPLIPISSMLTLRS